MTTAPLQNLFSHFGVYAFIVDASGENILLIKKALGCYTGLFDLPGGTMEPQELLEETLCREVLEETDCTITTRRQLGTFSTLYPFKKDGEDFTLRHIGAVYLADIEGKPRKTALHGKGDDSDGCIWQPLSAVTEKNAAPIVLDAVASFLSLRKKT